MYDFDQREIERQVFDFMRRYDAEPIEEDSLVFDGNIHRYKIAGDKHGAKSGAYCLYLDGWPAGWICNWRLGVTVNWKFEATFASQEESRQFLSSEEYKEMMRKAEERKKRILAEREKRSQEAILEARKIWAETSIDNTDVLNQFSYLRAKHVEAYGGIKKQVNFNAIMYGEEYGPKEGELIIPLRDINGEIQSLQFIYPDGTKRFFTNAPVQGAFFSIGLDDAYLAAHPNDPILIGEGYATMATVYRATHMPCVAAMNAGNLLPVAEAIKAKYPDRKIIITADNDDKRPGVSNVGLHKARVARDKLDLQAVVFPPFSKKEALVNSDWNDYEAIHGQSDTARLLLQLIRYECLPQKMKDLTKKVGIVNAQDLLHKKFNEVNWAVDGKSLLALHLSLSLAMGGCALGKIDVEQGDVLYLALEDTERRILERIKGSQLGENPDLSRLDIVTSIPRQDEGGLDFIRLWLSQHSEAKLVIVDTLQRFRKLSKGKLNVYAEDYEALTELKKIADEFNVAFVVIHHLKKMSHEERMRGDWINQLSGSAGITGCADTIISLQRDRVSTHGIMRVTGRDVEEKDYNMKLDGFGWFLEGELGVEIQIPAWKDKIIKFLMEHEKITPMSLSDFASITIDAAKKQLQRLCKSLVIKRLEHGVYVLA